MIQNTTPLLYCNNLNKNDDIYFSKLDKLYSYCYKHKYESVIIYGDDIESEVGRNLYGIKSVIPDPDYYNEETNIIIAYSIDDLIQTGYVYKLLYRAQKLGVRIEIAHKEIKDNYTDEELDVLAYLDEQESLISDRYLKQN